MPVGDAEPGNQPTGALPVPPIPRAALVTGGAQRIGRALSLALAEDGFAVAVHYHGSRDAAENLVELIRSQGGAAVTLAADLADEGAISALLPRAELELGPIGCLVNNAAHQASFKSIADITDHEWEHTFKVNIHAMFYLTKAAVPHMKKGACIINTASINADMPNPTLLAYATTKGAIQNFNDPRWL